MKKKDENKKRGRTALLVVLSVLICLLLTAGVLAYRFRAEISALLLAAQSTPEDVAALQSENDAHISEILDKLSDSSSAPLRDLTDEERENLAKGELSEEDALALIRGETPPVYPQTPQESGEPQTPASPPAAGPTADKAALQSRIDELLAQIYLLRATFLNEIDALIARYKAEYKALPKEQRGTNTKLAYAEKIVADGAALEAECDERLDAILSEMKPLLLKLNGQTELLAEIRTAYVEQKRLKKTEIYNRYVKHIN